MSSGIKRVDPRRPWHLTPDGLRRIILGEIGNGGQQAAVASAHGASAAKPLRPRTETTGWHLAIVHSDRGRLSDHARQAIAAAAILAKPEIGVLAVVFGELNDEPATLGADRIAVLPDLDAGTYQPELKAALLAGLVRAYQPRHIFMPDNADADGDLGRRLIASGIGGAAHVTELGPEHVTIGWSRGAQLARSALPQLVMLEPGTVDSTLPFIGTGEPVDRAVLPSVSAGASPIRDLGLEAVDAQQISLEEADFIVSAGNGVQNVDTFGSMAKAFGAVIGASRVAVDEGRFGRDKQVGATGKTVTATTYVAIGISGAVQHLQGIKDCRHVIAINRDAGAPIVKRADLTLIGDAEAIMQAVLAGIAAAEDAASAPNEEAA